MTISPFILVRQAKRIPERNCCSVKTDSSVSVGSGKFPSSTMMRHLPHDAFPPHAAVIFIPAFVIASRRLVLGGTIIFWLSGWIIS